MENTRSNVNGNHPPEGPVYKLLKVLAAYFPEDEQTYDFCEFLLSLKLLWLTEAKQ